MIFKTLGGESFSSFKKKKKQSPNIWIDTELKLSGKQSSTNYSDSYFARKKDAYSKGTKQETCKKISTTTETEARQKPL